MPTIRQTRRPLDQKTLRFETLEDRRLLAAGALDRTFGFGGMVTTDFSGVSDWPASVALQNDGKIVVAGLTFDSHFNDVVLARYNADGTLDSAFGQDGKVVADFGWRYERAASLMIQNDGKLVVAIICANAQRTGDNSILARYNADGTLDATFGSQGSITVDYINFSDAVLQADSKIVIAGTSNNNSSNFALARYNTDGTLDTSFDGDGKVTTDIEGIDVQARAVVLQSDGKIVLAGYRSDTTNRDFVLARYNMDGTLDTSFGVEGKVATDFGGSDETTSADIGRDGKIVVAGYTSTSGSGARFALARYNTDGTLDTSFDGDGKVITPVGGLTSDYLGDVAVQDDGRILVAGQANFGSPRYWDFVLVRYNPNGTLDSTFDGDGKVTTDFDGLDDRAEALVLQRDGRIVVAGRNSSSAANSTNFALARYEGDPILPPALAGDYNRSGTVDAADYLLWRNTQDLVVAAHSGADGDGDGFIDQDDYDIWKANFGRTLPAATALAPPAPLADTVTVPIRSFDVASNAILPKDRPHNREFQPTKRDIAAFATSHDLALLAWLAAKTAGPGSVLSTVDFSGSPREPVLHPTAIQLDEPLEVAFASIAETTPNDFN